MPSLNTTYFALPVARDTAVISVDFGRKNAEVWFDAQLLPSELKAILENSSNALAPRIIKAVQSVLQSYPGADKARLSTTSTFGRFQGIPLEAVTQVTRVISQVVSECLAREMDPIPA